MTSQDVTMPASKTGINASGTIQTYSPQDLGIVTGKTVETGTTIPIDKNGNYSVDTPAGNTTFRLQGHGQYYSWTSTTTNIKNATNFGTTPSSKARQPDTSTGSNSTPTSTGTTSCQNKPFGV